MFKMLQNLARMVYHNLQYNNVTKKSVNIVILSQEGPTAFCWNGTSPEDELRMFICIHVERKFKFTHQNLQELLAA